MRILFTFAGGRGHLDPLTGVAAAAVDAGHEVTFAGRPRMVAATERLGFRCVAAGTDTGLAPERVPLVRADASRERMAFRGFAGRIARERARDLLEVFDAWRPDLLVCDQTDFGAIVAGERLGIPYATVEVTAPGFIVPAFVADASDTVRGEHGLRPDPDLAMLTRHLVLSPFPQAFRDPEFPLPGTGHVVRLHAAAGAETAARPESARPDASLRWLSEIEPRSAVYFTLGTVFPLESGDLIGRVLAGLRELPMPVIVTTGPDFDPGELGPRPPNVHLAPFLPQHAVMSRSRLVVSHAGSGTVLAALEHGLPMLSLPIGADQPLNARRCEDLGIGRTLDAPTITPAGVRDAALAVMRAGEAGEAAATSGRIRDEIAALPGPATAVALLERLRATWDAS